MGLLLRGVIVGPYVLKLFGKVRPIADSQAERGKPLLIFFAGLLLPRRPPGGTRRSLPTAATPTTAAAYRAPIPKARRRRTVDVSSAYALCTFGILSRDRARLVNVQLLLVESVMGPKSDCAPPSRHLTGNRSAIEARSCHAGVPVGRIAL